MPGLPEMECVIMAQYPGKKRPCHTHIKYKSRSSGRLHSRIEIFMALQDFKPEKKCELEWAQKWIFLLDVHFYAQNLCMTVLPHHIQVKYRIAFFFFFVVRLPPFIISVVPYIYGADFYSCIFFFP